MPQNRVGKSTKSAAEFAQPLGDHSEVGCGNRGNPPRREFSARTKRQAWERANGFCEGWIEDIGRCNAPLERGRFVYEHLDPDWFSKNNELENCAIYCWQCAKIKTHRDVQNIAKSKRIINKRIKAKKTKRGFKGWRLFDGTVVHAKR